MTQSSSSAANSRVRKPKTLKEQIEAETSNEYIHDALINNLQNKHAYTKNLLLYYGATPHQYISALFNTLMHNNVITSTLEISNMDLSSNIEIIGQSLTHNSTISSLVFYNVVSNDALINAIVDAMKTNATVQKLCMCNMNINETHVPNIAAMVAVNKKIKTLKLNNNRIGNAVGQIFEASVTNSTLTTIHINNNMITDPAPINNVILKNPYLTELSLSRNRLTGHQGIVSALITNTRLQYLDLSETNICNNDVAHLCQVLSRHNRHLTNIQLRNNHIDSSICNDLIELIENPECQLCDIDLDYNDLDYMSLTRIILALDNNKSLKRIRLYMNNIGSLHFWLYLKYQPTIYTLSSRDEGPGHAAENRIKRFLDTEGIRNDTEGVYGWCKNKETDCLYKFDHTINSHYVIIEVDEAHHFEYNIYKNTSLEDNIKRDVIKMKDALMNNRSLIRVNYKDIFANTNNWQIQLRTYIEARGKPQIYYIEHDNEYQLHKNAMNVES